MQNTGLSPYQSNSPKRVFQMLQGPIKPGERRFNDFKSQFALSDNET